MENIFTQVEGCSDEDLELIISYAGELLAKRHMSNTTYENEFIDSMVECGVNEYNARTSLEDFKALCAIYMQKADPLYREDIKDVLKFVLHKNGYMENQEADQLLGMFVANSFGNNIPSMKSGV